jgi:uncharacterized protein (TIGR03437 family)
MTLHQTRYRLRAGEPAKIDAPPETLDFVWNAKSRTVTIGGAQARGLVFGPNGRGDQVLLAASLTMKPGEYAVTLSAVSGAGEERAAVVNVTLDPLQSVPSSSTVPPVVLLNGLQLPSTLADWLTFDTCPVSIPSDTFGSLETQLTTGQSLSVGNPAYPAIDGAGVPVVYFFDNCVEDPNGLIENLGNVLGDVLSLIRYDDGTLVPQVDLVSHSMGGLIVRAYLSGLQTNGALSPPLSPRVRKFIEIATPNFGSFLAANWSDVISSGSQTAEMIPGSTFLWNLATWNQRGDDLRGVDGLAIVGDAGYWQPNIFSGTSPSLSDGVVSITSASLGFVPLGYARSPSRTRIVPYCHVPPGLPIDCSGSGIADVDQAPETGAIVLSFLENTSAWESIGNSNQTQYGGVYFALENAAGTQYTALGSVSLGSVSFEVGANNAFFFDEFVNGTGTLSATSTAGQGTNCGSFSVPGGYYSAVRCKSTPVISSVGPLLPNVPGWVVQAGTTITIAGAGFGAQKCSTCQVLAAAPGSTTGYVLLVSSWTDQAISASFLPTTMPNLTIPGLVTIYVELSASASDSINIMAAPASTIAVAPTSLQFAYTVGGAIPAAQSVQVTSSGSGTLTWSAIPSASWLSVAPASGTAPSTVSVLVSPTGLGAGTHTGSLQISAASASNSPVFISVTLTVTPAPASLAVSPQSLTFNYTVGGTLPAAQTISITNTGGGTLSWTASASAAWVGLSPASGTAPTTISVSVSPATLAAGSYPATVQITATGATGSPASVSVTLVVQAPQPTVSITAVANGASFQAGFASATWVSIFGTDFSQTTRTWQDSDFVNGLLPTSLSGVSATINGLPAYVEYISPTQVNVLAPDDATVGAVQVQVTTAQGESNSLTAHKQQFAPAFFTIGGNYVAAQHADYTYVGKPGLIAGVTTQPAKPGEIILIYGTGFGPTNPPLPSAQLVTTPAVLANSVQVTIGGVPVQPPIYAGLVEAGLYQFNVTVPNVPNGDAAVVAQIGGVQTQTGVSITIQQ